MVGSLARGTDFDTSSDIDFLVLECLEELRYRIEADVEDTLEGIPFDVTYLDEVKPDHFRKRLLEDAINLAHELKGVVNVQTDVVTSRISKRLIDFGREVLSRSTRDGDP